MRDTFLKNLAKWHAEHPYRMLLIVVLLTIMFMWFSTQLNLTLRWADLLPENDPRTIQFNEIIEDFVTSTNIVVVVQGDEENIKAFADELAPRLLAAVDTSKNAEIEEKISVLKNEIALLSGEEESQPKISELQTQIDDLKKGYNKKLVRRVDYKTEVDFLRNHGHMGGKHGIFDHRRISGKKGSEGNQQHGNNQYPFGHTKACTANPIHPAQKGDVQHVFDDNPQDTDNNKYTTKNN